MNQNGDKNIERCKAKLLKDPIKDLIEKILPLFKSCVENVVKPVIEKIIPVIETLADVFGVILKDAIELVTPIISGITDVLGGVIDFITNVFKGNWEGAWDSIVSIFKSIFNTIPKVVEKVINGAIDIINGILGGINKVSKYVGLEIGEIPHVSLPEFHTGGIIDLSGRYEAPIMAKDGEMVLTEAQQKRLFDIANGMDRVFPQVSPTYNNNNTQNEITINHNETYNVRSDYDIQRISEDQAALERQIADGKGG